MNVEQGEALERLRGMAPLCVDAIVTDPPYFLPAQHYSGRAKWPRSMADLSVLEHFYRDVFAECRRVTKPDAPIVVFCDGQSYPVFYSLLYPHWDRLIDIVWDKDEIGMGAGVRRQHEWILIGVAHGVEMNGWERSVMREKRVGDSRTHPAEKPVGLLRRLIRLLVPPGGVVVDPFTGSGATGEAALAEARDFIGIELDARYAADAARREPSIQSSLFEAPDLEYYRGGYRPKRPGAAAG